MAEEFDVFSLIHTWDIVPLPSHAIPITCRWIYRVKTYSDGSLECYKAHLVAHGFQQEYGHNYKETFIPVAYIHTVRTLVVTAVIRRWVLH